jgi:DNA repair photolyase
LWQETIAFYIKLCISVRNNKYMKITEYKTERLLSKTVLNFSEYVINPYRGCQLGCLYCYVKTFKAIQKRINKGLPYGKFVDVKINSIDLLKKEIKNENPISVVLGASTEIYQPVEKKYELTRNIIKILNQNNVKKYLLTKSDLIIRDIDILTNTDTTVFFTINSTDDKICKVFENNSASYQKRLNVLKKLYEAGIKVILHIGPLLPKISNYKNIIIDTLDYVEQYEFENLNLFSVEKNLFLSIIENNFSELYDYYVKIFSDADVYNSYWKKLKEEVELLLSDKKKYNFFFHKVDAFFDNNI